MLFPFHKNQHLVASESGAVIPFVAIVITITTFFAALSLDLGDTMRRRGILHSALDSGVLRGAQYRALVPATGVTDDSGTKFVVRELAKANLRMRSIDAPTIQDAMSLGNFKVNFPKVDQVDAKSIITHDNWFAHVMSASFDKLQAPAYSLAEMGGFDPSTNNPQCGHVVLIMDLGAGHNLVGPGGLTIHEMLKEAAYTLIQGLPDNYYLDVITYSRDVSRTRSGTVGSGQLFMGNNADRLEGIDHVANATGGINRNTPLGLTTAAWSLSDANPCPDRGVVLFTHGMPDLNTQDVIKTGTRFTDKYNCGQGNANDEILGNAISWADQIRANFGPLYVVSAGEPSTGNNYDPNFLRRLTGKTDYPNLSCPRPLSGLPPSAAVGEYINGLDDVELKFASSDINEDMGGRSSQPRKHLRLVQ